MTKSAGRPRSLDAGAAVTSPVKGKGIRCPKDDCNGGHPAVQRTLSEATRGRLADAVPAGVTGPDWQWLRCGYCSTVWALHAASPRVVQVLGYFDRDGGSFVAAP